MSVELSRLLQDYIESLPPDDLTTSNVELRQDLRHIVLWALSSRGYQLVHQKYPSEERSLDGEGADLVAVKGSGAGRELRAFVLWDGAAEDASDGAASVAALLARLRKELESAKRVPAGLTFTFVSNQKWSQAIQTSLTTQAPSGVAVDCWSSAKLVQFIFDSELPKNTDQVLDAALFPARAQPFVSLALHSLSKKQHGAEFDKDAVEYLLDVLLPVDREPPRRGEDLGAAWPDDARAMDARRLVRTARALALFLGMLSDRAKRVADGNTLPTLDSTERVVVRLLEHTRRHLHAPSWKHTREGIENALNVMQELYVLEAEKLAGRLRDLLEESEGLALPVDSERVDYPLRSLRFASYFACAGMIAHARSEGPRAQSLADVLWKLVTNNPGGVLNPVIDDQLIEICAVWKFWAMLGQQYRATLMAAQLCERLVLRNEAGFPMPALYLRAGAYPSERDVATVAEAHIFGRDKATGFDDRGSLLLSVALYWAQLDDAQQESVSNWARGFVPQALDPTKSLDTFDEPESKRPERRAGRKQEAYSEAVYVQSWQPPPEAPSDWYVADLKYRGVTTVYDLAKPFESFVNDFQSAQSEVQESCAQALGRSVLDWFAWKVWRNPPPMSLML